MSESRIRRSYRFTVTPEHLIRDKNLSDRAVRTWMLLDRYAGDSESAFPSRFRLADDLSCSKASLDRAIDELVKAGWLHKERRAAGDVNLYTLMIAAEPTDPPKNEGSKAPKNSVVTCDDTPPVVTGDDTPAVTSDDTPSSRASTPLITGDEKKEASPENQRTETLSATSLRSVPGAEDLFDEFWRVYPRKVGKTDAQKAWQTVTRKTDPATVLAGARRFAADPNLPPKHESQYIAHPATWLRQGRWEDEPLPPRIPTRQQPQAYDDSKWDERDIEATSQLGLNHRPTPAELDDIFGTNQRGSA